MAVSLTVKWAGKEYQVAGLEQSHTVLDLKLRIMEKTGVRPERQKLLNLKVKGKFWTGFHELKIIYLPIYCATSFCLAWKL